MAACNESLDISEEAKDISMLVVMGVTGAGKSHFINQLAGVNITEEGQTLKACMFNKHTPNLCTLDVLTLASLSLAKAPISVGQSWWSSEESQSWS